MQMADQSAAADESQSGWERQLSESSAQIASLQADLTVAISEQQLLRSSLTAKDADLIQVGFCSSGLALLYLQEQLYLQRLATTTLV